MRQLAVKCAVSYAAGRNGFCAAEYGFARRKLNLVENNFIIHSDAAGGSAPRRIFLGYAD